jgi:hypothetical protein
VSIELLARGKKGREGKGSRQRRPAPFKRSWWRGVKRKGPVSVHTRWRITRGVRRCDCGGEGGVVERHYPKAGGSAQWFGQTVKQGRKAAGRWAPWHSSGVQSNEFEFDSKFKQFK